MCSTKQNKMSEIYKKVGKKYVEIAPHQWLGFPMDGIWIVKYRNGRESSASCVARLDDLPEPYPFYNMCLDRDEIAGFIQRTYSTGETMSIMDLTDKLIVFLSKLNMPDKLKIKHPQRPTNLGNINKLLK